MPTQRTRSPRRSRPITRKRRRRPEQDSAPEALARAVRTPEQSLSPDTILSLQRLVGNQNVQRLIAARDQTAIQRKSKEIAAPDNQFYGHGAFMGAALDMWNDAKWNAILAKLMPDVHKVIKTAVDKKKGSGKIIPMMENNPVMAAYGMWKSKQLDDKDKGNRVDQLEAMEWDVWLDPDLMEKHAEAKKDEVAGIEKELVDTLWIAHGNKSRTVKEHFWGDQYDNIKDDAPTDFGGKSAPDWMHLYGAALTMATAKKGEEGDAELGNKKLSFKDTISLYKELFGKKQFSVVLDVKSKLATSAVLKGVISELNRRGVHVYGVGTFRHEQLTDIEEHKQTIGDEELAGAKEVKFYHRSGDFMEAAQGGKLKEGDHVMFNIGSLIEKKWFKTKFQELPGVIDDIKAEKDKHKFHLGGYVQENAIHPDAANLLVEITNKYKDVFDMGFAWGGIGGLADEGAKGTGLGVQDSVFAGSTYKSKKKKK